MEVLCMDLDFTLVRYQVAAFTSMMYDVLAKRMVTKGYSDLILDSLWKSRGLEFTENGLVLDVSRGIIMSLGIDYTIKRAYHGFISISTEELNQYYGTPAVFPINPDAAHVSGHHWAFFTHFTTMEPALYSVCVELLSRQGNINESSYQQLEHDLESTILECFDTLAGEATITDFYDEVFSHPGKYLQAEARLPHMLREIKDSGTKLVIVTNSYEKYTEFVCRYVLGREWRTLFDEVVVGAGKPGYFKQDSKINGEAGGFGSLKKKYPSHNFTFIGDHFINDVYASKQWGGVRSVAILSELESEKPEAARYIRYLARFEGITSEDSAWMQFLANYSDHITPSLECYLDRENNR